MSKSAYLKFKKGEPLSRKQAMAAQCYECNGYDVELSHDCLGINCSLYPFGRPGAKVTAYDLQSALIAI